MTAEHILEPSGNDIEIAQQMAEWFSDYVYGFSNEIQDLPHLTQYRLARHFGLGDTIKHLDTLKEILLTADEDYQHGLALYVCGYPDDAVDALSEKDTEAINSYLIERIDSTALNNKDDEQTMIVEIFSAANAADDEVETDLDEPVTRSSEKDAVGLYVEDLYRSGKKLLSAEQEVELAKRIEAGLAAAAMLEERMARLESVDDKELEWLVEDGKQAMVEFTEKNVRLVVSIAKRYHRRATPSMNMADFISEGNAGMIHAIEKFDYTKGYKFSTYATWWIRQAISRAIADQSRTIRLPNHMAEKIHTMWRIKREFIADNDREPTDEELAKEMKIDVEKLEKLQDAARREPVSIHRPLGDNSDGELGDLIVGDDGREYLVDLIQAGLSSASIMAAIESLKPRHAEVIKRRFGFYGVEETFDEVGARLGVSRERVRQIQNQALRELMNCIDYSGQIRDLSDIAEGEKKRTGRPRNWDLEECIENGRDILNDGEMEVLFALHEAGTQERAAHQLGISLATYGSKLKVIREKVEFYR